MKIKWLGHSSFLITASQPEVKIITDPYQPQAFGLNYGPIEDEADIVTVSHDHGDHNYVAGVKGNPEVVKGPGKHQVKGVTFTGLACHHDASRGSERGANTVFSFTVDNMRCCHMGDLGHALSDEQIAQLGSVDVLFIPVGGVYTLDLDGAIALWQKIKPKVIVPMHFKTEKCSFVNCDADDIINKLPGTRRLWGPNLEYAARARLPTFPLQVALLSPAL